MLQILLRTTECRDASHDLRCGLPVCPVAVTKLRIQTGGTGRALLSIKTIFIG